MRRLECPFRIRRLPLFGHFLFRPEKTDDHPTNRLLASALLKKLEMYILAYTAYAFPEDYVRFLAAGLDDIPVKPISRQRLEELVGSL